MPLNRKECGDQNQRDRDHKLFKAGGDDIEAFHRGQNRNGRCDNTIAVKQGDADQASRENNPAGRFILHLSQSQRGQGDGAPFAAVVGAHDDEHIFDRHDQNQRPDNHG